MKDLPIILLGAGGHAKVLLDIIRQREMPILGICDPSLAGRGKKTWRGLPVLGDDDAVHAYAVDAVQLVNGVGSLPGQTMRRYLFETFTAAGYDFATLVHPAAVIGTGVTLGRGAQVMVGAVVQADASIGDNAILNTGACVDHDCTIGVHVHIAPGAVLSGDVRVGCRSHIGTGASLVQGVVLGADVVIGAGTTVLGDVPAGYRQTGQPPRPPARTEGN